MFGLARLLQLTGDITGLLWGKKSERWPELRRQPNRRAPIRVEELEARLVPTLLGQQLFPADNPWNQNIANAPLAANSAAMIAHIGASTRLTPNWYADNPANGSSPLYGMPINIVHGNSTATVNVIIDNYPGESDIVPVPIPQNAVLEGDFQNGPNPNGGGYGENGNPNQRGDSHLIVWDEDHNIAYELYGVSRPNDPTLFPNTSDVELPKTDTAWHAAQETVWNMNTNTFRTLGATSADAAGLSILAGLARPDEGLPVAQGGQGVINHALRVTLPGGDINPQFVYPASHVVSVSQGANNVPLGSRLRLANTPAVNTLRSNNMPPESQILARAMQQYGLIVADIGSAMYVSGASASVDANNNINFTWNLSDIFATNGLEALNAGDFEVVNLTPVVTGLSASSGAAGSTITITGQNFSGAAGHLSVLFVPPGNSPPYTSNGQVTTLKPGVVAAGSVTILDDQHIQVVVPNGSGTVDVQVLSGQLLDDTLNSDADNATAPVFGYGISAANSSDLFSYSTGTVAPAITTQPMSQTVAVGQTASFTAAASGSPAPTVQWQVSTDSGSTWSNIAGATTTTYSFTTTASQNGNEYRALFTNSAGSATSYAATLAFSAATAGPTITTQPTNQTVAAGQSATFTAAASGSPAPTVQWQVSTDGGATWSNIAGATWTTLTVPAASAQNGNKYRAVFSNNILVNGDFEGSTFTDAATGDVLPSGWSFGPPSPANLSSLNVATAVDPTTFLGPENGAHYMRFQSTANNGTRDCLYQDLHTVAGQTYTVSFWVALTSTSAGNTLGLDPVWDENTSNQQTMSNAFYVAPTITGPVNYQFFSFTETASSNTTRIDFHGIDAIGSILLDNVSVIATATTNPATLTVTSANTTPSITTQPANQTVTAGQTATFTAAASGSPTPTVQWQVSTNGGSTWTNVAGATATSYSVTNTTTSQSGSEYRAVFTNSAGSAATNAATLTVNAPSGTTTITFQQGVSGYTGGQDAGIDTQYAIYNGGNGVQYLNQPNLEIGTDGQGYVFESLLRFSNLGIPSNAVVSTASLTVTIVDWVGNTAVTGYYVNNAWSTADGKIGWVHRGNGLNWATPGALGQGTDLVAGKSFTLPATNANGPQTFTINLDPSVVQSWVANPTANQGILLVTNAARTVNVLTAENATVSSRPRLRVTFSTGAATAPGITTQPVNQTVTAGQTATFTAAANGSPTPTVQWQVSTNGGSTWTNVAGATATSFSITNTTTSQSGSEYRAVFTNSAGSATTSAATLTVNTPAVAPAITLNPQSQTVNAGSNVILTAGASGSPTPTVQWQVSTGGAFTNIAGATSTTYSFTTAVGQNGNKYRAVFTNSAGSATTSAATLTVNTVAVAPTVTLNPQSQTVAIGSTVTLTAGASGSPPPTVQWQVSTGGAFTNIPGATSTTYSFTAAASQSGNQFRAVFTNSAGQATTSAATLTTTNGIVLGNGQQLVVNAGQTVTGVTVLPGGYLLVRAGGTDNGSVLLGGDETVEAGGQAIGTTVDEQGSIEGDLEIFGTGIGLILNNGYINVDQGGVITNTTINGDIIYVAGGGTANNTTIYAGGSMTVIGGGVANGTILNGGEEFVRTGAVANGTTANNGGTEYVFAGGVSNNLILNNGANATMLGTVNGATINVGAAITVFDGGGSATGALVDNGSLIFDTSSSNSFAGQLTGTGVLSVQGTGKLVVNSVLTGNMAVTIGNSSSLELAAAANAIITFGYQSTLRLDNSQGFTGSLVLTPGYLDVIDLGDVPFTAGVTSETFVENAAHTQGVLTVSDGNSGPTIQLTLLGDFSAGTLTVAADGAASAQNPHPGTLIRGF